MALRIEDYALIGDCKTAALVARDGSIDWLCWPRFDSAACFAALLGKAENGRWLIAPKDSQLSTSRRYRPGTLVLETEFRTETGSAAVIDFMPPGDGADLVRIVAGQSGRVVFKTELVVRFNYGAAVPWVDRLDNGSINAIAGPERVPAKILERSASSRSRPASPFPLPSHMAPRFKVRRRRSTVSKRWRARRRSGANGAIAVPTSAPGRKRSSARSSL
jgi:GH15 family glucan-1,4-alpha-glucosidase